MILVVLFLLVSTVSAWSNGRRRRVQCKSCPSGWHIASGSCTSFLCERCDPGRWAVQVSFGVRTCSGCAAGKYSNEFGRTEQCTEGCPEGKWSHKTRAINASECKLCDRGKRSNTKGRGTDCGLCPKGKYNDQLGQIFCQNCAAGKFLKVTGQKSKEDCKLCQIGRYSSFSGLGSDCSECFYATTPGFSQCPGCSPGKYKNAIGSDNECGTCPIGFYTDSMDNSVCSECPAGYYAKNISVIFDVRRKIYDACLGCPRGKYGTETKQTNEVVACQLCIPGRYSEFEAVQSRAADDVFCTPCKGGTWSDTFGAVKESLCTGCDIGRYSSILGASKSEDCFLCKAGTYSDAVGANTATHCKTCPAGYTQQNAGAGFCLRCFPGTAWLEFSQEGSSNCVECERNTFASATSSLSCTDCPTGRNSSVKSAVCSNCIAGRYMTGENESSFTCFTCPRGFFTVDGQKTKCSKCPPGQYNDNTGSSLCFKCLPGSFNSLKNASMCTECPVSKFQEDPGQTYCKTPPNGTVAGKGKSSTVEIAGGFFATKNPKKPVLQCLSGKYGTIPPSTLCHACPIGWSSTSGALRCIQCEKGKYSSSTAAPACLGCNIELRQYSPKDGSVECEICTDRQQSTGIGCVDVGIDDALEIPAILRVLVNGSQQTQLYVVWTYGSSPLRTSAPDSTLLSFSVLLESRTSTSTSRESVSSFEVPVHVPVGDNSDRTNRFTFTTVLKQPAYEQTIYLRISAVVLVGSTQRLSRSAAPNDGKPWTTWECNNIDVDRKFLNTTSANPFDWTCIECPSQASCKGKVTYQQVRARFGHWRNVNDSDPLSSQFLPCVYPGACLGAPTDRPGKYKKFEYQNLSISNLPERCNEKDGYLPICNTQTNATCRLCQTCSSGYSPTLTEIGKCNECPSTEGAQLLVIVVVLGSLLFISLLIFLKLKSVSSGKHVRSRAIHATLKRILLTHLQIVTLVASLNVPWPSEFLSMVAVFSSTSTVSQHLNALSCEMARGQNPVKQESRLLYVQTIMLVFTPPITILLLFVYFVVLSPVCKCMTCGNVLKRSTICNMNRFSKQHRRNKSIQKRSISDLQAKKNNIEEITQQDDIPSRPQRRVSMAADEGVFMTTRDAWVYSVTLILYIMYPTLVRFPFELLQCRDINGIKWLMRDLEERCYHGNHLTMVIMVGIPALVLYALGIPLTSFFMLKHHRHKLNTNKYRFRLGLLYSGFREERYWWEMIVSARKLLIISLASFGFNERLQVHIVLGLMLVLLLCHYTFLPFDVNTPDGELLHRVERNSLVTLISMLWAGVVFNIDIGEECISTLCVVMHNTLVVFVILVNVIMMCYGVCLFVYFWLKRNHLLEKIESMVHVPRLSRSKSWKLRTDLDFEEGDGLGEKVGKICQEEKDEERIASIIEVTEQQQVQIHLTKPTAEVKKVFNSAEEARNEMKGMKGMKDVKKTKGMKKTKDVKKTKTTKKKEVRKVGKIVKKSNNVRTETTWLEKTRRPSPSRTEAAKNIPKIEMTNKRRIYQKPWLEGSRRPSPSRTIARVVVKEEKNGGKSGKRSLKEVTVELPSYKSFSNDSHADLLNAFFANSRHSPPGHN